jgi:uncharacterized membrane protein YeiH
MLAIPLKYTALFEQVFNASNVTTGLKNVKILTLLRAYSLAFSLKSSLKGRNIPFAMQLIVTVCVIAFGGSSLFSLTMARPMEWLLNPLNPIIYSLICLKVFYFPGDLIFTAVEGAALIFSPLFSIVDSTIDAINTANAINSVLDAWASKSNIITLVLAGLIQGTGGSIIANLFNLPEGNWKIQIPIQFQSPLVYFQRPLSISIVYAYLLTRERISRPVATGIVIVLSVFFSSLALALSSLSQWSCCKSSGKCNVKKEPIRQLENESSTVDSLEAGKALRPGTPTRRRLRTRALE